MIKKILMIIYIFTFTVIPILSFNANEVYAETAANQFKNSLKATADATGHTAVNTPNDPAEITGLIIKIILSFMGVAFLVLMIYGGYIWMLARGNEQQVEKAKNILKNSIIGIIIVLAAYAITAFVANEIASGVTSIDK